MWYETIFHFVPDLHPVYLPFYHPCVPVVSLPLAHFNVYSGLLRQKFTELRVFPTDSLKSVRANLFMDACKLGLVLDELCRVLLIDCCDSALRPISKILSDDIWVSISTKECVPRNILRSCNYLTNAQSQSSSQCSAMQPHCSEH